MIRGTHVESTGSPRPIPGLLDAVTYQLSCSGNIHRHELLHSQRSYYQSYGIVGVAAKSADCGAIAALILIFIIPEGPQLRVIPRQGVNDQKTTCRKNY